MVLAAVDPDVFGFSFSDIYHDFMILHFVKFLSSVQIVRPAFVTILALWWIDDQGTGPRLR